MVLIKCHTTSCLNPNTALIKIRIQAVEGLGSSEEVYEVREDGGEGERFNIKNAGFSTAMAHCTM